MALTKLHENQAGNSGNYWAPTHIHYAILDNAVEVRMELFKDQASFDAGKTSMGEVKNVTIKPAPADMSTVLNKLLASVKTTKSQDQDSDEETPFFSDAV